MHADSISLYACIDISSNYLFVIIYEKYNSFFMVYFCQPMSKSNEILSEPLLIIAPHTVSVLIINNHQRPKKHFFQRKTHHSFRKAFNLFSLYNGNKNRFGNSKKIRQQTRSCRVPRSTNFQNKKSFSYQ